MESALKNDVMFENMGINGGARSRKSNRVTSCDWVKVPDAGQPVGHQSKNADQQDQNRCTVLQIVVQFSGHSTKTEKADHLQRAEQTADALRKMETGREKKNDRLAWLSFRE